MAQQISPDILGVGDHVRLKSRAANLHQSYQLVESASTTILEPVEGLVFSIREISSGRLVKQAEGKLEHYVVELLYDHTFNARYASLRNAPRGADHPSTTTGWRRLCAALRSAAERGQFFSSASLNLLTESPLTQLLDGWKVIKIQTTNLEKLERPEPILEPSIE